MNNYWTCFAYEDQLDEYRDDDFPYNPHVTCYTEDEISKPFNRYCLMKDDEIVTQWRIR